MRRPPLLAVIVAASLLGGLGLSVPAHAQMTIPPQSFEDVITEAQAQDKPILVEIYAPWCPYCQRMQENVYSNETVRDYLDETFTYVRLNSDTTAGTHQYRDRTLSTKQLASVLGAKGVPTTTFLKADGTPIARQPGYIKRPQFFKIIRYVGSGAYENQSFQEFTGERSE
jgi:thioredoxin-related protein